MPASTRRLYLLAATIFVWFALALQLYLSVEQSFAKGMSGTEAVIRFASFFTVTSNLIVAVLLTLALLRFPTQSPSPNAMSAGTSYIIVVGITYHALLRKTWDPQGAQLFADIALHYVMPAVMTVYWLLFVPKGGLRWRDVPWWFVYPILYLAFTLLQGPRVNWYPYPFIDVSAHGYGQIAINSAGLFVLFLLVAIVLLVLDRFMTRRSTVQAA